MILSPACAGCTLVDALPPPLLSSDFIHNLRICTLISSVTLYLVGTFLHGCVGCLVLTWRTLAGLRRTSVCSPPRQYKQQLHQLFLKQTLNSVRNRRHTWFCKQSGNVCSETKTLLLLRLVRIINNWLVCPPAWGSHVTTLLSDIPSPVSQLWILHPGLPGFLGCTEPVFPYHPEMLGG